MKKILYLGLDPAKFKKQNVVHYPVIKIVPRDFNTKDVKEAFSKIQSFTHFIFTSKTSVRLFFDALEFFKINMSDILDKCFISIGPITSEKLKERGCFTKTAKTYTQEGVIKLVSDIKWGCFFYPRSSLARDSLACYLEERSLPFIKIDLYDTVVNKPDFLVSFDQIQEIVFTSPSTVDAFIEIFGKIPMGIKVSVIGPITKQKLINRCFQSQDFNNALKK